MSTNPNMESHITSQSASQSMFVFNLDFDFNERKQFLSKVYRVLFEQLITLFVVIMGVQIPFFNNILCSYPFAILIFSFLATLYYQIMLYCFSDTMTRSSLSFNLTGFNIATSIMASIGTITTPIHLVLIALFLSTVVLFVLNHYATTTTKNYATNDITSYLMILSLAYLGSSFVAIYFHTPLMDFLLTSCGVLLFSFYIVYDTQQAHVLNNRAYRNGHVIASMQLYLDFINLFLRVLRLLRIFSKDKKVKNEK